MKPVYQTIFDNEAGNCLQACIASIFELDLDEVPNFCANSKDDEWLEGYNRWMLERFGLQVLILDPGHLGLDIWWPIGYHVITGDSPRGPWQHAVVGYQGEMVHDPHPDGRGLVADRWFDVFVSTCERV